MASNLPFSGLPAADGPVWDGQDAFLGAGRLSERTVEAYGSALRIFADFVVARVIQDAAPAPLDPALLTTDLVLDYAAALADHSAATRQLYIAVVLRWLAYLAAVDAAPAGVDLQKLRYHLRRSRRRVDQARSVVELDQVRQAIPAVIAFYDDMPLPPADDDPYNHRLTILRNRAFLHVLRSTAARLSEVGGLTREQVGDGTADTVIVYGKGGRPRTLFFDDTCRQALAAYLAARDDVSPALWVSHSRNSAGRPLSTTSLGAVVKAAVAGAGADARLSAHDFRHYRATQLLRDGVPLHIVQEYLGHASILTTRSIYAPVVGAAAVRDWLNRAGQGGY